MAKGPYRDQMEFPCSGDDAMEQVRELHRIVRMMNYCIGVIIAILVVLLGLGSTYMSTVDSLQEGVRSHTTVNAVIRCE